MYSVELKKLITPDGKKYIVEISYLGRKTSSVSCPRSSASAILKAASELTRVYNDNGMRPFGLDGQ